MALATAALPLYEFDLVLEVGDETLLNFDQTVTGINWNLMIMSECIVGGIDWKSKRKAKIVANVLMFEESPFQYGTLITIRVRKRSGVGNI